MKVLVTFALETEFASWRSMRKFRLGRLGSATAYFADFKGTEVTVVLTGVGPSRARQEASNAFRSQEDGFDLCVSSGLMGALRPQYQIAEILAASAVVSESLRPGAASHTLPSSGALLSFAIDCGATKVTRFFSADHIVSTAAEKDYLASRGDAVEMESFEILLAAANEGVPAIAIRSVSDISREDLPLDLGSVLNNRGQVSVPRVLGQLALRPQSLPALMRLGSNSHKASEALAHFLDRYLGAVVGKLGHLESGLSFAHHV